MKTTTLLVCFLAAGVMSIAADRAWQTGTWRDVKIERPKVVFGMAARNPNDGGERAAPPPSREVRTYVIETGDLRLELREDATVDTPRLDVLIGEPVTFAVEKDNAYIKDADGREHKLKVRKTSKKQESNSTK